MTARRPSISALLAIAGGVALFAACLIGPSALSPADVLAALCGFGSSEDQLIVHAIRLPRALAAYLVGAVLGGAGAALQGLLRNPLAGPGVLGISPMAALAATGALYYGLAAAFPLALPLAAVAGAGLAAGIIALAAVRISSILVLILLGVGLSSVAGALTSLLMNLAPNPFSLCDMVTWMLGSVANRSLREIALSAPLIGLGLGILFLRRQELAVMTLGEEAAFGLGVDLQRLRLSIVIGASLAGAIGFVGVVAPHIVRPFVAHDPGRSIVPAALLGGLLLVLTDIGVRIIPTHTELKLGVLATLIGAPVFI
ncbi:MAG: iron ABC transporter permease [Pseudomonadota bacterium]